MPARATVQPSSARTRARMATQPEVRACQVGVAHAARRDESPPSPGAEQTHALAAAPHLCGF
eukprot:3357863-Pleurochrysis_carterae.AAC.2